MRVTPTKLNIAQLADILTTVNLRLWCGTLIKTLALPAFGIVVFYCSGN